MRIDRRSRMPVWLARTQVAYGRFLLGRARDGDAERAAVLVRASQATSRACGLTRLAGEAAELIERLPAARMADVMATRPGSPPRAGSSLSGRELDILPLLAEGRTNREIGERLRISQHTAANHIRSILLKTGCANRTEAAAWAMRKGLVGD
jgi:DNA-binding NarL/FixJ family response regulator